MTLYHIRTLKTPHLTSLVSNADFPNDLLAIAAARRYLRKGEALEVWRADTLIYHTTDTVFESPPAAKAKDTRPRFRVIRNFGSYFGHAAH